MAALAIYGYREGKPNRLTYPYDPDGNACGLDTPTLDYPFIYFPVPHPKIISRSVCLKTCPT